MSKASILCGTFYASQDGLSKVLSNPIDRMQRVSLLCEFVDVEQASI